MFCHQCQETMRNSGCNAAKGVCGKTNEVANLQDLVLHVCKGIGFWGTKALDNGVWREDAALFVVRMLFATITNANFAAADFERWVGDARKVRDELKAACVAAGGSVPALFPDAATWTPIGIDDIRAAARAGKGGWAEIPNDDIRALRSLVLYGLKGMSAYVEHAHNLGKSSKDIFVFMFRALSALTDDTLGADELTALVLETG
ncbi:MAG TPA: hydroxylamine reductase, partial [Spirochaetia bacterium]